MGGERKKVSTPRGVTVRRNKGGDTLQIDFVWNAQRCREVIALQPTPANIRYADGLRREIMGKIALGKFAYTEYFPNSSRAQRPAGKTVGDLLRAFMCECDKAVENRAMSPSTVAAYRKVVSGHLQPQFGAVKAGELAPLAIKEWLLSLGVTAKTARNILTPLRLVLDDALNSELIDINPLHKLALGRLLARSSKPSTYKVDPFSADEVAAILARAEGSVRNLFSVAFYTGLRTSELIALRWQDVDLEAARMRVAVAQVTGVEKGPKTAAGKRLVELTAPALAALSAQRAWTLLRGGRVFDLRNDKQVRERLWRPLLAQAGVRYRNPYQTRHTFASTLLSGGANPWWVAEQMGHEGVEMIFRHYGRWIQQNGTQTARGQ